MIKILFVSFTGFPKEGTGGPNKVIHLLANNLPGEKFRCEYVSKHGRYSFSQSKELGFKKNISFLKELLFNRSFIYRKIFTSSYYLRSFFNKSLNKISELLIKSDFDILNAHDVRTIFNFESDRKIILSIHSNGSIVKDMTNLYGQRKSLQDLYSRFNELEINSLQKVSQIIFPSYAAKKIYFEDLELNSDYFPTKVIYNGIDIKKINSIYPNESFNKRFNFISDEKLKILNVANHVKVKNIDKILLVLRELKKKTNKFLFINIGSGPLTKKLKDMTNQLNLNNNVIFLPMLNNDDVIRLMKVCDFYISASERVIFDLVILEALACGMIVLANNDGGNKEIINDNSNGYLFELNNHEKLVELFFLKETEKIKINAKKSVLKFTLENMIKNYISVYEDEQNKNLSYS